MILLIVISAGMLIFCSQKTHSVKKHAKKRK